MTVRSGIGRACLGSVVSAAVAALMWVASPPATAHESREVGPYTFVVGFSAEPAYTANPNAVSLTITDTASGKPFVGLTDGLDVDVRFGTATMTTTMEPAFAVGEYGTPGEYTADFVPSRPGQYTFHFHGTVGGVKVDEEFVSGPDTFDDVEDLSAASFPVHDPSTGEIADRLDRELARMDNPESGSADSADSDGVARVLSVAALAFGAGALGTALVLVRRRP